MTAPDELTSPLGSVRTVVLWDIDGTLLSTGGAGRIAWARAAADVWGRDPDTQSVRTAGLTDVEIAVAIGRQLSGEPRGNEVLRLIRRYEELLSERLRVGRARCSRARARSSRIWQAVPTSRRCC